MILVNTDYITGKNLDILGLVKGSTIQSKHSNAKSIKDIHKPGIKPKA